MNIPEEAIQAAAEALAELEPGEDWPSNTDLGGHAILGTRDDEYKRAMEQDAKRALTAALPHIRAQIAADIRKNALDMQDAADTFGVGTYSGTISLKADGMELAARITEEGITK